jgi:hypothetical protein
VFQYDTLFAGGPAQRLISDGRDERVLAEHTDVRFHVPDSYAVGFAIPADTFKLTFEYDYITYSQLIDGTGTGLPLETAGQAESADPRVRADGVREVEALTIDNAHQVRAGIEWAPVARPENRLYLRAGAWYDPDHRLRSERTDVNDARLAVKTVQLSRGQDEGHFSFGIGALISGRVQLDTGIDLSPRVNTFALSAVVYLGKTLGSFTPPASPVTSAARR